MTKQLAIVIPAYKPTFFDQTLASIAAQTSQSFTLYIGDDCSPYDIKSITDKYINKIDFRYHKFDTNLGGKDLVAQWERCIDLTQGEPWVWLFSDDDLMSPNCVETVMNAISNGDENNLFRFNVDVIDSSNNLIRKEVYPSHFTCEQFYKKQTSGKLCCFVVEFVFSRKNFINAGKFQNFDLAWGSDAATWLKLSKDDGITTLNKGNVLWRSSGENITTTINADITQRKLYSTIAVYSFYSIFWGNKFYLWNIFSLCRAMWGFRKSLRLKLILSALKSYSNNNLEIICLRVGTLLGPRIIYK